MSFQVRLERLGTFDVTIRNLQRQILRRVPGDPPTVRIEFWLIKIVAVFIRLAPGKNAAFDFDTAPNQSGGAGSWAGYQSYFIKAQKRQEQRHYRQRLDLMMYEKQRQEVLKDLGADPYVD